jgi:hypothetical protein
LNKVYRLSDLIRKTKDQSLTKRILKKVTMQTLMKHYHTLHDFTKRTNLDCEHVVKNNVLKPGPVIDPVKALGHWVTGRISGSLVGLHDY